METPPLVPLLGTALWRIDNSIGEATNIYTLPPDMPVDSAKDIVEAGISIDVKICDFHDPHPNTYRLTLTNANEKKLLIPKAIE